MSLIFTDGFDGYSVEDDLSNKWDQIYTSDIELAAGQGRFGGDCLRILDDQEGVKKFFPLTAETTSNVPLFITASILIEGTHDSNEEPLLWFDTSDGTIQASLYQVQGTLHARRGTSTTQASSVEALLTDVWYTLEIEILADNSGYCIVRIDGSEVINHSGDFRESFNWPGIKAVSFVGKDEPTGQGVLWDDVIIYQGDGTDFNSFLGPTRIVTLAPNASGDSSDGTPTSGSNYENVDETGGHDGDTTNVSFSTAGDKDLYGCEDLPISPSEIKAVVVSAFSKAGGNVPREAKLKVKHSTTEADGSDFQVPHALGYKIRQDAFSTNPSTTSAWTESEINAMQIGIEVVT